MEVSTVSLRKFFFGARSSHNGCKYLDPHRRGAKSIGTENVIELRLKSEGIRGKGEARRTIASAAWSSAALPELRASLMPLAPPEALIVKVTAFRPRGEKQ